MVKIYKLLDPKNKEIKYIGKTINDLEVRLIGHITQLILNNPRFSEKNQWISSLLKEGYCPIIELVELVNKEQANQKEKYWINYYKTNNFLFNIQHTNHKELGENLSNIKSKKIYEYNLEGEFIREWKSITEAALHYNIENSNICYAASGKRKCAGVSMWRYNKEEKIEHYFKSINYKPVYQYDLEGNFIQSFKSGRHVFINSKLLPYKAISKCCIGNTKTAYGYRFSFEKTEKLPPLKKVVRFLLEKENEKLEFYSIDEIIKFFKDKQLKCNKFMVNKKQKTNNKLYDYDLINVIKRKK
jgi:hypothetical protein